HALKGPVSLRPRPMPTILVRERDDHFCDQGVREARDLDPLPLGPLRPPSFADRQLGPTRARVDSDRCPRRSKLLGWNLDGYRMRVEACDAVHTRSGWERDDMCRVKRVPARQVDQPSE